MSTQLTRNEICIIGHPRCDYVFNSSRACFIGYGFNESKLEVDILTSILEGKNIEVFEAGNNTQAAQNAFCSKICSKIITSQFCAILLNNDHKDGTIMPNANVNMEYGLMLGFHKHVIPFQREEEGLPFNVAGLDTIKYTQQNFKTKATEAIDTAIQITTPSSIDLTPIDKIIDIFFLSQNIIMSSIENQGTKNLYDLGRPAGYYLFEDFSGMNSIFVGIFTAFPLESTKWRIKKLEQIINARFGAEALQQKVDLKLISQEQSVLAGQLHKHLKVWIIVQNQSDKDILLSYIKNYTLKIEIFTLDDILKTIKEYGLSI